MRKVVISLLIVFSVFAAELPSIQDQIFRATLAAPAGLRDGAAVLGYDPLGKLITLRQGKNELICLASNPAQRTFSVACYHKDLEPFMARGRQLSAQNITGSKRKEIRFKEIEAGKLAMPRTPRTLYVLEGNRFDVASQKVEDGYLRWVIYTPFATAESTGLQTKGVEGGDPWLMDAGTAAAHIMINPPRKARQ